ncbi:MAG TPA: RsmE family RNA methyltransferase [Verrucomicrobiae bacterium]|jgi:16S rRNA (uracil1498-N3)-methyltransferase|nr:RsmE family RNA methyltransferase [Verrucomicrobiae bacterium]
MHRFYLPPEQCRDKTLTLTGREAHHALTVLRVRAGERVVVLDGAGRELMCDAQAPGQEELKLTVAQDNFVPPLPFQITLLQAIPKGKIMDGIVQKAAELGAHRIVPLLSDRVVTQLDDESGAARAEKWRATAIEAIKQCGSAWLPQIEVPVTPKDYLARNEKFELPLIASLQSDRRHPHEYFETFVRERQRLPVTVCVWVGPEGDFTPAEMNAIKSGGALPISLGRLVLRSETAAIYALSVLNYELQAKRD